MVRDGYKQTEVGVIPVDWKVVELGDAAVFLDSQRVPIKSSEREAMSGVYPYYGASGIIDYVNKYLFDEDLILLGEDGENIISRNSPLAFKISGKTWVNNHAHVIRPATGFNIDFLCSFLESLDYTELNSGTAQPKLNRKNCELIKVVKPTLPEQRAIARALSDTDALLSALDALIGKKEAFKRGMMEGLLSGERRLEGFSGEWETKRLGDIAILTSSKRISESEYVSSGIPFYRGKEVSELQSGGITSELIYISNERFDSLKRSYGAPEKGEILVTAVGTLGNAYLVRDESDFYFKDGNLIWVKDISKDIDPEYLEYQFAFRKDSLLELAIGSSQKALTMVGIEPFQVLLPPSLSEQRAIATVLSDLDAELSALRARRAKLGLVKGGMMEVLLSGEVRLV